MKPCRVSLEIWTTPTGKEWETPKFYPTNLETQRKVQKTSKNRIKNLSVFFIRVDKGTATIFFLIEERGLKGGTLSAAYFKTLSWWRWGFHVLMMNHTPRHYMGVSKNRGTPKRMVYNRQPYFLMDDLGVPLFSETSICFSSNWIDIFATHVFLSFLPYPNSTKLSHGEAIWATFDQEKRGGATLGGQKSMVASLRLGLFLVFFVSDSHQREVTM